jgi:hypothetical protein
MTTTTFAQDNCLIKEVQDVMGQPWGRGRNVTHSSIEVASMGECADAGKALLGKESEGEFRFMGASHGKNHTIMRHLTDLHAQFKTRKVVLKFIDETTHELVTIKFRAN